MKAQDAIKMSIDMTSNLTKGYLEDLKDEELFHRPAPGCNHINWQLGHLIVAENHLLSKAVPGSQPALPTGFEEKYAMERHSSDDRQSFCSKAELLAAAAKQREATLATLAKLSETDLDKPSGVDFVPTAGAAISAGGSGHWMMHLGQWAVIRRQLGRKPLF